MNRILLPTAVAACLCGSASAQGQLRDALRDSLTEVQFASGFANLVMLSEELELSGARYSIDNDVDTEASTIVIPFHRSFDPWGEDDEGVGLYLEGALGYVSTNASVDDIFQGALPGQETAVDSTNRTYGAFLGLGPEFVVDEGVTFAPIVNFGAARIENDADYDGPGADASADLFDGIAFNWDGILLSSGGAARLDWIEPLNDDYAVEVITRYDLRFLDTVDTDDDAQEFSSRLQILTLRTDLTGPTGWKIKEHPIDFRTFFGYRRFFEGSLFGAQDLFQVGGALNLDLHEKMPIGRGLSLNGALVFGEDLTGWTLGVGLAF